MERVLNLSFFVLIIFNLIQTLKTHFNPPSLHHARLFLRFGSAPRVVNERDDPLLPPLRTETQTERPKNDMLSACAGAGAE